MTHDLDDISVYACWTRLNETPEDIEAYSQNPKDDSCDGVDCGLEC